MKAGCEALETMYSCEVLKQEAAYYLQLIRNCASVEASQKLLFLAITHRQYDLQSVDSESFLNRKTIVRDCARTWRSLLQGRSDSLAGFSVAQALWDIAHGISRPDLQPGFFAEIIHLFRGVDGRDSLRLFYVRDQSSFAFGREGAKDRSDELDRIWSIVEDRMSRYEDGLSSHSQERRLLRRATVLRELGGTEDDWQCWEWHIQNLIKDPETLNRLVPLLPEQRSAVRHACQHHIPFGITPYYVSLMDEELNSHRDQAIRAQVLPPDDYIDNMISHRNDREYAMDFMQEHNTSPIDLVTRRYPAIVILKPFNTCPQICVYCQRNWEIEGTMTPNALAPWDKIEAACRWIEQHAAIKEVLITGGDFLSLDDTHIQRILERVARIPQIELIRIGSRIPVTLPMRITESLSDYLGSLRIPGQREVCLVTHVEHPYEVTPEMVLAVDRIRRRGMGIYNQMVFTYYVSRRFEAARLRMLLRRIGIDPYYTFAAKGKEETRSYQVPLARILQEFKEEARLLPGIRRTDEPVYNVPGLGKNYLRAVQHRDLISILPDGSRVYEFHPWEKNIASCSCYVGVDVPIFGYLSRLINAGEDVDDYANIWYYF